MVIVLLCENLEACFLKYQIRFIIARKKPFVNNKREKSVEKAKKAEKPSRAEAVGASARGILLFGFLVLPYLDGFVPVAFFEDSSAEEEERVDAPEQEEDPAGDHGADEGFAGKGQEEEQRCDHHHRGKVGEDVEAGGGGLQAGVDLLHQDHTVGGGSGQGAKAHQEEFVLKAPEAFLGDQTDVEIGDGGADQTEEDDGEEVALDVVDLNGCHARDDHQVKGEAGDAVHLIVVDVLAVHHLVAPQTLDHKFDQHRCQRCPQEVKAPGDAVGKGGQLAQEDHKTKGKCVRQGHKADLQSELIHRLVVRDLLLAGGEVEHGLVDGSSLADEQRASPLVKVDVQNAEHRGDDKSDRGQRKSKAAVARKLCRRRIGKVDVPAERVSGALAKGEGQDQTAYIGDDVASVAGEQKEQDRDAYADEGLQHIRAALQGAKLQDLRGVGLVGKNKQAVRAIKLLQLVLIIG